MFCTHSYTSHPFPIRRDDSLPFTTNLAHTFCLIHTHNDFLHVGWGYSRPGLSLGRFYCFFFSIFSSLVKIVRRLHSFCQSSLTIDCDQSLGGIWRWQVAKWLAICSSFGSPDLIWPCCLELRSLGLFPFTFPVTIRCSRLSEYLRGTWPK